MQPSGFLRPRRERTKRFASRQKTISSTSTEIFTATATRKTSLHHTFTLLLLSVTYNKVTVSSSIQWRSYGDFLSDKHAGCVFSFTPFKGVFSQWRHERIEELQRNCFVPRSLKNFRIRCLEQLDHWIVMPMDLQQQFPAEWEWTWLESHSSSLFMKNSLRIFDWLKSSMWSFFF